eukprot:1137818-Pelagomonas_calceolata.AAC.5
MPPTRTRANGPGGETWHHDMLEVLGFVSSRIMLQVLLYTLLLPAETGPRQHHAFIEWQGKKRVTWLYLPTRAPEFKHKWRQ